MPKFEYRKPLEEITRKGYDHVRVFESFVQLASIALDLVPNDDQYFAELSRWPADVPMLFSHAFAELVAEMQDHPFTDLLGETYAEWGAKSRRDALGEFYTPRDLSRAIATMLMPKSGSELASNRPTMILEPACGSGGMILAVAEVIHGLGVPVQCIKVQGWDINRVAINMSMINTTLWAIPFEGVCGDTLKLEVKSRNRNRWFYRAHGFNGGVFIPENDTTYPNDPTPPLNGQNGPVVLQGSLFGDLP